MENLGGGGRAGSPREKGDRLPYPGLLQQQEAVFIEHGLGAFQQLRGDRLELLVHCGGRGPETQMLGKDPQSRAPALFGPHHPPPHPGEASPLW